LSFAADAYVSDSLPPELTTASQVEAVEQANAPRNTDTAQRAVRASMWALVSFGAGTIIRLASNLVLTRLLFEEVFGMMAIITTFLVGLSLMSDIGINRAIVQSPRGEEPIYQDTAWSLQIIRGVLMWLVAFAISRPVAAAYDAPLLASLLPVAAFTTVIQGFQSPNLPLLNRKLAQKQIVAIELTTQLVGTVTTIIGAYYLRSVWALVIGHIISTAVHTVLTHVAIPGHRSRFRIDKTDARDMFVFGRWLFIGTAMSFLGTQSDRLILGKIASLEMLGVYSIAFGLAHLPGSALSHLVWNVLFPTMSRAFEGNEDPTPPFRRGREPVLLIGGVLTAVLISAGPFLIDGMYDDRYADAAWMIRIVAVSAWLMIIQNTLICALVARGASAPSAVANTVKLVGMLVAIPYGNHLGGFRGALIGLASVDAIAVVLLSIGTSHAGMHGWMQQLRLSAIVAMTSACGILFANMLQAQLPHTFWADVAGSLLVGALVALLWLPVVAKQLPALKAALKR
jgi:O-antigen/teichoic acid export membrane protein